MAIRAVLWDIDDTLFDYTGADRAGMTAHLAAEGLAERFTDEEQALALWRAHTEVHWARFAAGEVSFVDQRRERVRDYLDRPGWSDAAADAWFDRYMARYRASWALFPDVLPALDRLSPLYRHGVLSNSSATNQDPKLRALGLRERFEVLVCAAEIGVSKPAAAAFLAACEALALPCTEVAYVGDRLEVDAQGASAAGLTGIWLDREGAGEREAVPAGVLRITGLAQLPGLLAGDTRFGAPSPIR
ncbi:HAD family hydrolase [Streptomyces sp. NPDC006879]|uniref:HAD family hydrolase n=1 Tax=Streptomyces sp. NPDC006879 TaxID=3364767 RepID=UPI0036967459